MLVLYIPYPNREFLFDHDVPKVDKMISPFVGDGVTPESPQCVVAA